MRIVIYAFDGITTFHLSAPLLTFGEVSKRGLAADWDTTVWTATGSTVSTSEGLKIDDLAGIEAAADADMLVFPSWPADLPEPDSSILGLIRNAHARGVPIAGFCLGALPVVASGILDGRSAATHWAATDSLATRYASVEMRDDALYIDHGDVITSAGTASALDACLHIVRERLGTEAATQIARHIVIAPHRDGDQAQFIDRPVPDAPDSPLGQTIEWALANLDKPLSVEDLAGRASMSPRNFSRRFRELTGSSPAKWLQAKRLAEARRLLEGTTWSIARVAETCGFNSPVTFRQNFLARYSTTPTSYRHRFAVSASLATR
ncbi:GlxA family transcriptional regulator [Gulosibacter molinativorax]|uniref:AraC family transcriptional regulator n=1 Tax=Gulosibacter molinativorax TaxID=256821 RepID=A0ABT7C9J2_9MICO|nr:helix-turn-helix domain-containing protein [Gulosibacter molinativorax]MDJ1371868.1 AraC family transcriptional regulator [Gulosibacter molinativorax]QUY62517.1 Bacterial regulatory helix-turn-helix s, AraC family protein [Gulosibacter molinativorax]